MAILALTGPVGCSADVTAPFPESQALLVGTLVVEAHPGVEERSVRGVEFSGRLDPGRDARGALRPVGSGALTLLARGIEPVGAEGAGIRLYEAAWEEAWGGAAAGGASRPLEIQPPAVGGLPEATEAFRFGACAADRLPDAVVAVQVQCDGSFTPPVHVAWRLTVRNPEDGVAVLRLEGDRPPPPAIEVPRDWLPEDPLSWEVELEVTQRFGWSVAGGAYRTNLVVRWRHLWPSAP